MIRTPLHWMLPLFLAALPTGCKCSGDPAPPSGGFRALPPNACTLTDIAGCTEACDKGDARACGTLGLIYLQKDTRDLAKAEAASKKACESGIQVGCIHVSDVILETEDRRSEWPKAVNVYREACDQGELMACYKLGKLHEAGKAIPADKPKAIELYQQACKNEDGHINACVRLWVAEGHAMPWRSRRGVTVTCMEDLGNCPASKK